jgi:hypothetical protein
MSRKPVFRADGFGPALDRRASDLGNAAAGMDHHRRLFDRLGRCLDRMELQATGSAVTATRYYTSGMPPSPATTTPPPHCSEVENRVERHRRFLSGRSGLGG